jgi:hypothetical protein
MTTHPMPREDGVLDLDGVLNLTQRARDCALPRGVLQAFEVMGLRAAAQVRTNWIDALVDSLEAAPASAAAA